MGRRREVALGRVAHFPASSEAQKSRSAWDAKAGSLPTSPACGSHCPRHPHHHHSLLQTLSTQFAGAGADGRRRPWTYHLVQFADILLESQPHVAPLTAHHASSAQARDR